MNSQELIEKLKTLYESVGSFAFATDTYIEDIRFEEVEQIGGEGQGDLWYSVKYFPHYDIYLKVKGFYESYSGVDFYDGWDCIKEVKPKERTIIVYE